MVATWRKQPPIPSHKNWNVRSHGTTDHFKAPDPEPAPPKPASPPKRDGFCPNCDRAVKPPYTLCYRCYMALDATAKSRIRLQWKPEWKSR